MIKLKLNSDAMIEAVSLTARSDDPDYALRTSSADDVLKFLSMI